MTVVRSLSGRAVIAALAAIWFVASVRAQSFNVNFAPNPDAPGPAAAYAGAGVGGTWNGYNYLDGPVSLVNTAGAPTDATIFVDNVGNTQFGGGIADPDALALLFGKYASFISDGLLIHFDHLQEGVYDVITYAWNDQVTSFQGSHVTVVGAAEGPQDCGGAWTGTQVQGVTYTHHTVGTLTGTLDIRVTEPLGFGGACNGVQIRRTGTALSGVKAGSVNIDLGDTAGTPGNTYAGVGAAGTWNVVATAPSTTRLRALDGTQTDTLITLSGGTTFARTFSPPGDFESMQYDWWNFGDGFDPNTIRLTNVAPGAYRVVTYATYGGPSNASVSVAVTASPDGAQNVGGDVDTGTHVQGLTYAEHHLTVGADGVVEIVVTRNQPYGGGVSGVQLVAQAAVFCPCDFNHTGHLEVQDIFDFLNAWFAADPRGDFNHSGNLQVQDIFDFLGCWFQPTGAGC